MYNLTGQPGWMRFGFSPGWVGRSPSGLGPCAQLLLTGQWPAPQAAAAVPQGPAFAGSPAIDPEARLEFLKNQAGVLEQQLAAIKSQIENLEGEKSE
jgi:hypothetical protein